MSVEFVQRNPFDGKVLDRLGLRGVLRKRNDKWQEIDHHGRVDVPRRWQGFEHLNFAPQFLRHFPTQRLFGGFTVFLLSTGEFPAEPKVFVGRSLRDQNPTFALDEGANDGESGGGRKGHCRP